MISSSSVGPILTLPDGTSVTDVVLGLDATWAELSAIGFNVVTGFFLTVLVVTLESSYAPRLAAPATGALNVISSAGSDFVLAFLPLPVLTGIVVHSTEVTIAGGGTVTFTTLVVACAVVGVGWTSPTLLMATL